MVRVLLVFGFKLNVYGVETSVGFDGLQNISINSTSCAGGNLCCVSFVAAI